ncbi:NAD(P)-binding protein [Coprinopsis marcescibilis]|uniref:NAD(P)-binding protein n=1 Tax=Coprinopsis marcescibilis TaxID=230819 RepID=A0A5C3LCR1_COPMA|nr:NAD(P)-binding protein [Coprinopsis marcescibilis]
MARVVVVTGCTTGGIGFALCEEFARHGCKVYATSRRIETIGDFSSPTIEKLSLDVTSDESAARAIQKVIDAEGRVDVLVNNAGTIAPGPILEQSIDYVKKVLDTNTVSILRVSKEVMPHMVNRQSGLIVNIGSIVGDVPTPWNGLYSASKAAVVSISEVMAMELQPFNIQVLHVAPGGVKSNIAANASNFRLVEESLYAEYLPDILRRINTSQATESMANEEFARQVVGKALRKKQSFYTYFTLGSNSFTFKVFKWLPRVWVLRFLWKMYSKKA